MFHLRFVYVYRKPPTKMTKKPQIQIYAEAVAVGHTKVKARELAGYSKNYSSTLIERQEVFKTHQKSILNAFEAGGITDKLLTTRIKALINKKEKRLSFGKVITVDKADASAVSKGIELAMKVRGDFAPVEVKNVNPMEGLSVPQLMAALQAEQLKGNINMSLTNELLPQ